MKTTITALLLLVICSIPAHAQQLQLLKGKQIIENFPMEMLEDPSASRHFEEIKTADFSEAISSRFAIGHSTSTFWFRFSVSNSTTTSLERFLEVTESILHMADLYVVSGDGSTVTYKNGMAVPFAQRTIPQSNPVFPIHFEPGEEKEIYLHISSKFALFTEIRLLDADSMQRLRFNKGILFALYFGAVLALALYNLFLFLSLRDKSYLFYVLSTFSFIILQADLNGYFASLMPTELIYSAHAATPLFMGFLMFFSRELLETKKLFPRWDRLIAGSGLLFMFLAFVALFEIHYSFLGINVFATFALPMLLVVGYFSYRSGNKTAFYYLLALGALITMLTIFSLMTQGVLPYNNLTRFGNLAGSLIEIVLFSFALAYRINLLRQEKLLIELRARASLEKKVIERTQELSDKNRELVQLSITDPLTGIYNRLKLDEVFDNELRRAKRYHSSFGIILVDIDKFKSVNDTYGHQIGDQVLIAVTGALQENVRKTDTLGRWGGEEFLIICPEVGLDDTAAAAENLRKVIEMQSHPDVGQKTASFGVAAYSEGDTSKEMTTRVDEALYRAKNGGRNRVEIG